MKRRAGRGIGGGLDSPMNWNRTEQRGGWRGGSACSGRGQTSAGQTPADWNRAEGYGDSPAGKRTRLDVEVREEGSRAVRTEAAVQRVVPVVIARTRGIHRRALGGADVAGRRRRADLEGGRRSRRGGREEDWSAAAGEDKELKAVVEGGTGGGGLVVAGGMERRRNWKKKKRGRRPKNWRMGQE